ncbi:iron reductase domain protein [Sporormia fimetaria CBS 119925]|uniref:Iron reductase domain protein n=1 Tax=Sporormia fimetaria CBS 119925 TaxID=1340428 RepID=A0A6A6VQP0_9PLEO|nr:iron reductase domain protein [Sporormia fimetaria CBS 119925]
MLFSSCFVAASALVGSAFGAPAQHSERAAAVVYDSETGFTFAEHKVAYTLSASIAVRVAVPSSAQAGQPYDAVFQIIVPNQVGWAGIAMGGSMVYNPLLVGWANGQQTQASTRWATAHAQPQIYNNAQLQKLTAGNRANGTHWQFTVKCTGCTSYQGRTGSTTTLNPKGGNRMALVISNGKPQQPSNANSNLVMHEGPIYWTQSFPEGANANFGELVRRNGGTTTSDGEVPTNGSVKA